MATPAETLFADRYERKRLVGEGRRKRVYQAFDTRLKREVALALIDGTDRERARREIEAESRAIALFTDHPYIVTVFDAAWHEDTPYLVSEFMAGGDLQSHCKATWGSGDTIPLADTLRWTDQICQALAAVHEHGFIHCDVAPGNVWLDVQGQAHLGDFDSAVPCDAPQAITPETDDTTTAFQAPELARGDQPETRSDLYSLGATLHYLVSGEPPGGSPNLKHVPEEVGELLGRLIARSPVDRPESAVAVHGILEQLANPPQQRPLKTLLTLGEGAHVEFKGSLLQLLEPDPLKPEENQKKAVQKAITKTVSAFLNTAGGSLVVGVNDRGDVVGIEHDFPLLGKKPDLDGWELALKTLLTNALSGDALKGVSVRYEKVGAMTVAIVDVERRACETWLKDGKNEEFYVRLANSSEQLTGRALLAYVREAWPDR